MVGWSVSPLSLNPEVSVCLSIYLSVLVSLSLHYLSVLVSLSLHYLSVLGSLSLHLSLNPEVSG